MFNLRFLSKALLDIELHRNYLTENASPSVAEKVSDCIFDTIDFIAEVPEHGVRTSENPMVRYRSGQGSAKRYLIYWRFEDDSIDILRIIRAEHQSQRDTLGDVGE